MSMVDVYVYVTSGQPIVNCLVKVKQSHGWVWLPLNHIGGTEWSNAIAVARGGKVVFQATDDTGRTVTSQPISWDFGSWTPAPAPTPTPVQSPAPSPAPTSSTPVVSSPTPSPTASPRRKKRGIKAERIRPTPSTGVLSGAPTPTSIYQ